MTLLLAAARTSEGMKAGPIGLAVILILCIVCYFLFKSMSKHMRFVRENFPGQSSNAPTVSADGESTPAAAGGVTSGAPSLIKSSMDSTASEPAASQRTTSERTTSTDDPADDTSTDAPSSATPESS